MLELAIESQSSFVAVIRKDGAHMVDFAPTRGAGLHGESLPRKFTAQLRERMKTGLERQQTCFLHFQIHVLYIIENTKIIEF